MFDLGTAFDVATATAAGLGGIGGGAYLASLVKKKGKAAAKPVADAAVSQPNLSLDKLEEIRSSSDALTKKAKEWERNWWGYRERLKYIVAGESGVSTSTQLTQIVDLLRFRKPLLPGHESVSDHGSYRNYMDLTHIIYYSKPDKVWYRAPSDSPGEESYKLRKKVDEGLLEIADLILQVPKAEEALHGEVKKFAQDYAAHLLLNYRSSPTSRKPSSTGGDASSNRKQRQVRLNSAMNDLIVNLREYVEANPNAELSEVRHSTFQEVQALIDAEAKAEAEKEAQAAEGQEAEKEELPEVGAGLDLSVLNEDETALVTRFQENFGLFEAEEAKAVEKLLRKVVVSAEVIHDDGEQFVPEMRERGLGLAEENRKFAFTALSNIVNSRVTDRGIQLLHELRVDNRYLADQLESPAVSTN